MAVNAALRNIGLVRHDLHDLLVDSPFAEPWAPALPSPDETNKIPFWQAHTSGYHLSPRLSPPGNPCCRLSSPPQRPLVSEPYRTRSSHNNACKLSPPTMCLHDPTHQWLRGVS
jgi:hypothetical protein